VTLGNYHKLGLLPFPDTEAASRAAKHLIGIVDVDKVTEHGATRWLTTPISLSRLSDADLERYIIALEDLLFRMTGVQPEDARREAKGGNDDGRAYQTDYPPISAYEESSGSTPTPPAEPDDGAGSSLPSMLPASPFPDGQLVVRMTNRRAPLRRHSDDEARSEDLPRPSRALQQFPCLGHRNQFGRR
jgi:hypothetical protein